MDTNNLEPIKKDTGVGPIIGSIIIIILIVLGGLYFWGYVIEKNKTDFPEEVEKEEAGNMDDISQIEADLNSTNIDILESDMQKIDSEIDSAAE